MITAEELASLEQAVDDALTRADARGLCVLGRGEISLVLGWPADETRWACKRLPPFPTVERAMDYERTVRRYVDLLAARGVHVLNTDVRQVGLDHGAVAVYCVQPVLPVSSLATDVVRAHPERAPAVLGAIVGHILDVTDERVGLDAQLSNWAVTGDGLVYLDITTPFVRDENGRDALDTEVFLASLPWALRAPVRRFVTPAVVARYHQPRTVVLDLAANLIKERLEEHIPTVLAAAGERIEVHPCLGVDLGVPGSGPHGSRDPLSHAQVVRCGRSRRLDRRLVARVAKPRHLTPVDLAAHEVRRSGLGRRQGPVVSSSPSRGVPPSAPRGGGHAHRRSEGDQEDERRVSLTPEAVREICRQGHTVVVEAGAGDRSGFDDESYEAARASPSRRGSRSSAPS